MANIKYNHIGVNSQRSPEYRAWIEMRRRCYASNRASYRAYGAKGIKVCATWRSSFAEFIRDVGPRPSRLHSLDRIDGRGNYAPGNVRWATKEQQSRNAKTVKILTASGERLGLAGMAAALAMPKSTLFSYLRRAGVMR